MLEIAVLFSASFAMTLAMKDASFMDILYEVVSAGATVGLTRGMTPILTAAGKSIIIGTMYIGRIGPTTLAAALAVQASHRSVKVRMAEEKVLIG